MVGVPDAQMPDDAQFDSRIAALARPFGSELDLPPSTLHRSNFFGSLRQSTTSSELLAEVALRFGVIERSELDEFRIVVDRKIGEYALMEVDIGPDKNALTVSKGTVFDRVFDIVTERIQDQHGILFNPLLEEARKWGSYIVMYSIPDSKDGLSGAA